MGINCFLLYRPLLSFVFYKVLYPKLSTTFFFAQFRNQYDNDVSTWSPQGRIHQIEYAMEAVKQGAATVGIKSKTHAVLTALKRAPSELSSHQKKILQLDDHVGASISGLTADARLLWYVFILCV